MTETLGLLLVRSGVVQREDLYRALELQRLSGRFLGSCLLALGAVTPEQLRQALSRQSGLPLVDGRHVLQAAPALASQVPLEVVKQQRVVPFALTDGVLKVALYEPSAADALPEIAFFSGHSVQGYLADEAVVERAVAALYPLAALPLNRLPQPSPHAPVGTPPPVPAAPAPVPPPASKPAPVALVDRRRPEQILKPVREISNRDFAQALGLDEEPVEAPIVLTPKAPPLQVVGPRVIQSVVEAAEKVFEARDLRELGQVVVAFLQSFFERAAAYDLDLQPAAVLAHAGFPQPLRPLELAAHPVIEQAVASMQGLHGAAPHDAQWAQFFSQLGPVLPGVLLLAPVGDGMRPRLLLYADSPAQDVFDDLHDVAVLIREVSTALGIQRDPGGPGGP